jgi:hypothetical protein
MPQGGRGPLLRAQASHCCEHAADGLATRRAGHHEQAARAAASELRASWDVRGCSTPRRGRAARREQHAGYARQQGTPGGHAACSTPRPCREQHAGSAPQGARVRHAGTTLRRREHGRATLGLRCATGNTGSGCATPGCTVPRVRRSHVRRSCASRSRERQGAARAKDAEEGRRKEDGREVLPRRPSARSAGSSNW